MVSKEEARAEIAKLIDKFEGERNRQQSEADVRAGYIDLLSKALGWNVYNDPGQITNYRREGYVRGAGYVDVGLEIRGQPVLFLEAKRFDRIPSSSERSGDRTLEEKQAFRYARGRKIPYAILCNFERLHLFNADHERLIFAFDHPRHYLERFDDLWRLSPEEVERGSLPWWEGQLAKKDVDLEFLAALRRWRLQLARAIHEHNGNNPALQRDGAFDFDRLMQAVQRILDRLILVRYGDDKEVLLEHDLLEKMVAEYRGRGAYARPDHLMRAFVDLSLMMDEHHNTTLFAPGHVCEQVRLPNEALAQVIEEMNRISFRKFTSDILGNTYESYLGTKLALRNGQIEDEERRDIRKGRGIYYTPRWVVEYIVDNTLGRRLKELEEEHGLHAIEKARGLAVLDPACGSGSFLIYAYQVLADFYRRLNEAIAQEQARLLAEAAQFRLFDTLEEIRHLPQPVMDYPQVILKEHLFGVDLDPEAAEIAAVNLTMQAFADSRQKKLPLILNENIKVGNSLISGSEEELRPYFGDAWREKHPFNWEQEFSDVMARGGFNVVIGNPPYGAEFDKSEKGYLYGKFQNAEYQIDSYLLFIERAIELLRNGGFLGFIVPNPWLTNIKVSKLRKHILDTCSVRGVVLYPVKVFGQSVVDAVVVILEKEQDNANRSGNEVSISVHRENAGVEFMHAIPQVEWERRGILNPFVDASGLRLVNKIDQHSANLGVLCAVVVGMKPYQVGKGQPKQTREVVDQRSFDATSKQDDTYRRYIRGSDIIRYSTQWDHKHWISYGKWLAEPRRKDVFDAPEKIIIRQTGDSLVATLDQDQFLCMNNTHTITLRADRYDLRYLLGLVNSHLLNYYYQSLNPEKGEALAEVKATNVKKLPIRRIDFDNPEEKATHDRLVALVERMLELHRRQADKTIPQSEREDVEREIVRTDREIDTLVYDLYGLTEEERRLVEQT